MSILSPIVRVDTGCLLYREARYARSAVCALTCLICISCGPSEENADQEKASERSAVLSVAIDDGGEVVKLSPKRRDRFLFELETVLKRDDVKRVWDPSMKIGPDYLIEVKYSNGSTVEYQLYHTYLVNPVTKTVVDFPFGEQLGDWTANPGGK